MVKVNNGNHQKSFDLKHIGVLRSKIFFAEFGLRQSSRILRSFYNPKISLTMVKVNSGNHQISFHLGHNMRGWQLKISSTMVKFGRTESKNTDFPVFLKIFGLIFLIFSVLLDWFLVKNGLIFSGQSVWPLHQDQGPHSLFNMWQEPQSDQGQC